MSDTLYATFDDTSLAEKAVGALLDHGVRNEDISVISKNRADEHRIEVKLAAQTGCDVRVNSTLDLDGNDFVADYDRAKDNKLEHAGKSGISSTTAADAEAGAGKGAGIGLGVGVAAAIASIMIPGFGLVLGGGALAVAMAGAAATTAAGAIAGGVTGYLIDQGVPNDAAKGYEHAYKNGSAVITIYVPSGELNEGQVKIILSKYQAANVSTYPGMNNYTLASA